MKGIVKILVIFLVIDAIAVGGYLIYKSVSSGKKSPVQEEYEWIQVDEYYAPKNYVEEFIKNDSAAKGIFPVFIRNYGKDKSVLRRFVGKNFARPSEPQLKMMYNGLEDWMLIDLKYKTDQDREVIRTMLYVYYSGSWRVGDNGSLQ